MFSVPKKLALWRPKKTKTTMKMIAVALRSRRSVSRSREVAVMPRAHVRGRPPRGSARGRSRARANVADDLAPAHHQDAVAHREQLLDLGGDEEHGAAIAGEPVDDRIDLDFASDVDAARRLVHEEDRRLRHQPLGEHDLLLVAAGKALRRLRRSKRALMPSASATSAAAAAQALLLDELERRRREFRQRGERDVVGDRPCSSADLPRAGSR